MLTSLVYLRQLIKNTFKNLIAYFSFLDETYIEQEIVNTNNSEDSQD